jgi:signal transduction histidine kinase/DNA-binding NarL/FixJ family response regulator
MYDVGLHPNVEPSMRPSRGSRPRATSSSAEERALLEQRLTRSHFGLRLLVLGALPLACVALAASLLIMPALAASSRDIRQELMDKAQTGIAELQQRAQPGLITRDADLLQRAARRYTDDADVAMLQVLDNDGRVVFSHAPVAPQPGLDSFDVPPLQVLERAGDFAVWARIAEGGAPVGRVELSLTKARLTAAQQLPAQLLGVSTGAGLIGLGLAWMYVRRHILPVVRGGTGIPTRRRSGAEDMTPLAASKGLFLTHTSHELRTRLLGISKLTEQMLQSSLGPRQLRQTRALDEATQGLLRVAEEMLEFSKQEARPPKLAIRPCSLYELLRGSLALLEKAAQDKGLELQLELSPGLPDRVLLDEGRLRQVLLTLAQNAISLTESGWVKLHADAQDVTADSFELRIRVEDTRLESLRQDEPLDDAPESQPTGRSEGSELGLTMARELVVLMQGALSTERSGPGRVFQFVIPVARSEAPAASTGAAAVTPEPPPLQLRLPSPAAPLLLLDPDEQSQLELVELIENLGFEIEVATSGQQAIEYFLAKPYALILLNCEMPERAGYDTSRAIRAIEVPGKRVPIIACIAQARAEERAQMLASGMDDYLTQPPTRDALCRALAEWLPEDSFPASSGTRLSPSAAKHAALRQPQTAAPPLLDLRPLQGSERMRELFLTRVPDEIQALSRAAGQARREEVASRAHALKTSCLRHGAVKMAAVCALLESASELSEEQLEQNVKALARAFSVLLEQLDDTRTESDLAQVPASGVQNPEST